MEGRGKGDRTAGKAAPTREVGGTGGTIGGKGLTGESTGEEVRPRGARAIRGEKTLVMMRRSIPKLTARPDVCNLLGEEDQGDGTPSLPHLLRHLRLLVAGSPGVDLVCGAPQSWGKGKRADPASPGRHN